MNWNKTAAKKLTGGEEIVVYISLVSSSSLNLSDQKVLANLSPFRKEELKKLVLVKTTSGFREGGGGGRAPFLQGFDPLTSQRDEPMRFQL